MVSHYALYLWELYGLTMLTVWDLPAHDFFAMVPVMDKIDKQRQEREARERNNSR